MKENLSLIIFVIFNIFYFLKTKDFVDTTIQNNIIINEKVTYDFVGKK